MRQRDRRPDFPVLASECSPQPRTPRGPGLHTRSRFGPFAAQSELFENKGGPRTKRALDRSPRLFGGRQFDQQSKSKDKLMKGLILAQSER